MNILATLGWILIGAGLFGMLRKRRLRRISKGFGHQMQHDLDTPEARAAIKDLTDDVRDR